MKEVETECDCAWHEVIESKKDLKRGMLIFCGENHHYNASHWIYVCVDPEKGWFLDKAHNTVTLNEADYINMIFVNEKAIEYHSETVEGMLDMAYCVSMGFEDFFFSHYK